MYVYYRILVYFDPIGMYLSKHIDILQWQLLGTMYSLLFTVCCKLNIEAVILKWYLIESFAVYLIIIFTVDL